MTVLNIIGLSFCGIFSTVCFVGWFRAEKKLAKHGESILFEVEEDDK